MAERRAGDRAGEQAYRELTSVLKKDYEKTHSVISVKFSRYASRYESKDKSMRRDVEDGRSSKKTYRAWLKNDVFHGAEWNRIVNDAAGALYERNADAMKKIYEKQKIVFAQNASFQTKQIEKDAGERLDSGYRDISAVEILVRDNPELLPEKKLDSKKDKGWNRQIITNCVIEGILLGENVLQIALRIGNETNSKDLNASLRYAQTAITCAKNIGRLEAMKEAKRLGLNIKKKWVAVVDTRTRSAHLLLNGKVQELELPFDSALGPISYPGDPSADPANVWNCRCSLTHVLQS